MTKFKRIVTIEVEWDDCEKEVCANEESCCGKDSCEQRYYFSSCEIDPDPNQTYSVCRARILQESPDREVLEEIE